METLSQPHESSIQKPETAAMMAFVRFAEISKAIHANLPLDAVLGQIVTALKPLVGCNSCAVGIFDATRREIEVRIADESPSMRAGMLLSVAEFPIIEHILKSGDLLYVPNTGESSLWQQTPLFLNSGAFAGIPLSIDKDVLGIFFVGYPHTDPLTEEMRGTLLAFAQHTVSAIQYSRQNEQQRTTEERYRLIADLTSEAVYEYDPLGDDISWSEGLDRLLRYPQGSFPRSREAWVAAIHPDDRERVRLALDHAINQFAPFKEEYRVRRHDGVYCVVLDRATRFRSYAHEPHESRVIGAISDMTQT